MTLPLAFNDLPRRVGISAAWVLALGLAAIDGPPARSQEGPPGITTPQVFPAFDRNAPACKAPPGLSRTLAFAQDNEREFMQGVKRGLASAAENRKLDFRVTLANNDAARMIEQVQQLLTAKVGGVVAAPVDADSLAPVLKRIIWAGGYVGMVVPPPATTILNAPQYLTGKALGDAAAAYIKDRLRGRANVVLLTHDSLQFLAPRFVALRDALKGIPGVTIVADISPRTVNKEGGLATMRTILSAHPRIDVVLGADTVVLGALAALRAAGKDRADQFLGGIDGEPEAVAEIKRGGPYKTSVSLASPVFGYAMGQHAADWLDGRSIPQAIDILPTTLSAANMAQYEADLANPAAVYADPARRDAYLKMYGNICYDSRDQYVNFPVVVGAAVREDVMRLKGKTALVTGGASGFGAAIVRSYAKEGANVVILDLDEKGAAEVANQSGSNVVAVGGDVTRQASVEQAVRAATEKFGRLDIVVNNAGWTFKNKPLLDVTEAEFDKVFAINVKAIFLMTNAVVPVMRRQGGGIIINVGSTAGVRPRPGLTWYNATKGAVNLLSKSMAVELAPDKIRVNCIAPVMGETGLLEAFMGVPDTPENRARFIATIPLGRLSTPEDIASACVYLGSDDSAFITGVILPVDGGRTV